MFGAWNSTVGRIGGGTKDTKNYENLIRNSLDSIYHTGNNNAEYGQKLRLAFYIAADRANQLGNLGYTSNDIKETLNLFGINTHDSLKEFLNTYLPIIDGSGDMPKTVGGNQLKVDNVLEDNWLKDRYYRQGLAEVPYDNYAAMLHAGETVLTASTTAAINDMVMEYRNSQNQNYSLDAAIQNQTAQLIQKMDEIIHNMNLMSTTQRPINAASEKLKNNMLSLTSSLAFQN